MAWKSVRPKGSDPTMKAELVPLDGGPPIQIVRDLTVVGRREYCDVQIDHPSLSKRHAVLVKTDGLLILRDLASTNGTKVKGQRIRWAALLPDDRIAFGSQKFRVYLGPDDAPAPSERPRKRSANGPGPKPVAFAAPSPLGTPVVRPAPVPVADGTDSDDWRLAMKPAAATSIPVQLNDHELLIEDDEIVEVEDDDVIELP
jgi:hypothetical protein